MSLSKEALERIRKNTEKIKNGSLRNSGNGGRYDDDDSSATGSGSTLSDAALERIRQNTEGIKDGSLRYSSQVVDDTYLDSFLRDSQDFLSSAKSSYNKLDYSTAVAESSKSYFDQLAKRENDLRNRANTLRDFLNTNKSKLDEKSYKELSSYLDIFSGESIAKQFYDARDYYSQWETEADWKKAYDASVEYDKKSKLDTAAAQKEISQLDSDLREYTNLTRWETDEAGKARAEEIRQKYGVSTEKELKELLEGKKSYLSEAEQVQAKIKERQAFEEKYYSFMDEPDFAKYSKAGAAIENPTVSEAEDDGRFLWWTWGGDEVGNIVTYSRENADMLAMAQGNNENTQGNYLYRNMDDDEVAIYNYLLAKYGKEKGDEFLSAIMDDLRQREGGATAKRLQEIDIPVLEQAVIGGYGLMAGADQWASGVRQAFTDEKQGVSEMQYANAELLDSMDGLGKYAYQATNVVGNMLPSIALSKGLGALGAGVKMAKAAGAATMSIGAAGNAYADGLDYGMKPRQARTYGRLVGAAEGALEYAMGGIPALRGAEDFIGAKISLIDNSLLRIGAKLGWDVLQEISEEELQNFLEPAFRAIFTGEYDAPSIDELVETAIVTAISTPLMGGGETVINDIHGSRTALKDYGGSTDALIQEGLESDINSDSYKLAKKFQQQVQGTDGKEGKALTGNQIRNLLAANQEQITPKDMKKIQQAAEKRLTELGQTKDVSKLAELAARYATGQKLSKNEKHFLASSKYGSRVYNELLPKHIASGDYTTDWAEEIGTREVNRAAYNKKALVRGIVEAMAKIEDPNAYKSLESRVKAEEPAQVSNSGKAVIRSTREEIDLTNPTFKQIGKNEVLLEVDGKTVSSNDIDYDSEDQGLAINAISKIEHITPAAASALYAKLDMTKSVMKQLNGMDEAFNYGYYHYSEADLDSGTFAGNLTQEQKMDAYKLGQYVAKNTVADNKAAIVKMRTAADAIAEKAAQEADAKGFTGEYSGNTYNETQAGLLATVSTEGLQNAAELSGRQDVSFNNIGISDPQVKQAWVDAGLAYTDTDADGDQIYVVNDAMLLDERARRKNATNAATVKTAPKGKKLSITYNHGGGFVEDIATAEKKLRGLNREQRGGIEVAKLLHQMGIGTDFELFTSYYSKSLKDEKGNKLEVFLDDQGQEQAAYAGVYMAKDGKIRINLKAYKGTKGLTLNALSHELTHFIKDWSLEKYAAMAEFLVKSYGEKGVSMNELVLKEQARLKKIRGAEVSYGEAYDEVVANAFNRMLEDGKVMERIAEIRQVDKSLADKIIDGIRKFIKRFTKVYQENQSLFKETEALMEMKEVFEQLQNMFAEALVEASDNYQASLIAKEAGLDIMPVEDGVQYSYQSLAEAAGFVAEENEDGTRSFVRDGKKVSEVTVADIENSPIGAFINFSLEMEDISAADAKRQKEMFAQICTMACKTNDFAMTMQFVGSAVFTGMKANADKQYGTTYDFPSICTKTQAVIDAMSAKMVSLGRGLNTDEIVKLYDDVFASGNPVPCPECYVFSRWIGIGGLLDNIKKYQDYYGDMAVEDVAAEYRKMKAEVSKFAEEQGISFGKAKGALTAKLTKEFNKLTEKIEKAQNQGEKVKPADVKRLEELEPMMNTVKGMTWLENVYFADSSLKKVNPNFRVPNKILFDLNNGEAFATKYKEAWAFRTTQGAGYGKAITPYAEARLGEGVLVTNNTTNAIKGRAQGSLDNYFLQQMGKLDKKSREALKKARAKQKIQAFIGGQRFQSTSDARYENASDYLLAALEMQAMGGMVQVYTKVDGAVPAFSAWGFSINQSLMPLNGGLDANGNVKDTGVGGMKPSVAFENRNKHETAGTITIGVNDNHIRAMFKQWERDFIIPYHASGGKAAVVAEFRRIQEGKEEKGEAVRSTDYSRTQSDKVLSDEVLRWQGKTDAQIQRIHEVRNARIAILTGGNVNMTVVRSNRFLSALYDKLNKGGEWEGVKLAKSKVESQIFPNEFWDQKVSYDESEKITKDYLEYCDDLGFLHRFSGMIPSNGKLIPASGYDQNGTRVQLTDLAYQYDENGNKTDEVEPFFWKVLTDRRMYDKSGKYLAQKVVTLNDTTAETVTGFAKNNQGRQYDKAKAEALAKKIVDNSSTGSDNKITENQARGDLSDNRGIRKGASETAGVSETDGRRYSEHSGASQEAKSWDRQSRLVQNRLVEIVDSHIKAAKSREEVFALVSRIANISKDELTTVRRKNAIQKVAEQIYSDAMTLHPLLFDDKWRMLGKANEIRSEIIAATKDSDPSKKDLDSDGNQLSKGQQEFFKDTKVVDKNGKLLVMYHGSSSRTMFTVFERRPLINGKNYGDGYYFTEVKNEAYGWGSSFVHTVYVNLNNPYYASTDMEAPEAIVALVKKQLGATYDKLSQNPNWWGSELTREKFIEKNSYRWSDAEIALNHAVDDTGIPENGYSEEVARRKTELLKSLKYDGVIVTTGKVNRNFQEVVAFDSNQIKFITNKNPTKNIDMQYSTQETDNITNRDLLANAFEGISQNSEEYKMIQEYRGHIKELNDLEDKLSDLNAEIRKIRFGTEGPRDTARLTQLEKEAKEVAKEINRYDKRLLSMEASGPLRKVIEQERKKETQKTKAHVQEIQQNKKVRAEQAELRHKIRKTIRDLDKIIKHGNKHKNVKEDLQPVVTKALQAAEILFTDNYGTYDMIRNGIKADMSEAEEALVNTCTRILKDLDKMPADGYDNWQTRQEAENRLKAKMSKLNEVFARERRRLNNTKVSSILGELADAYASLENSEQSYVQGAYTEAVHNFLKGLQSEVGGTIVKDMTKDQLESVYAAYKMVLTTVRKANEMFNQGLKMSREQLGNAVIQEVMTAGGDHGLWTKGEMARSQASWNNMKPVWAANRIGSETFGKLMQGLFDGQYNFAKDIEAAKQFKLEMDKKYHPRNWDTEKLYEFESSTGKKFSLNLQQIMSLYAFSKREQAYSHLLNGGFVFEGNSTVIVDEKGRKKTYIHNGATSYKLNEATLNGIINSLTAEQKTYADEMQKYLSEVMGNKGNEVSMQLYGIKMFNEQFYFPLRSSGAYMEKAKEAELKKQQGQINLVNSGFTHAVKPEAKNPIILSGFMDVWAEHCNEMSMYHSMVLPMEDFRKVYNYSTVHDDKFDSASVYQTIQDAYGKAATDYIDQLYRELNAGATVDPRETPFKTRISKFKKAAVMLSGSVVVQQFSSIGRAYAVIDPKYFIGKKVNSDTKLSVADEMKKYAPVAIIKEMGGFDTGTKGSAKAYIMEEQYGKGERIKGLIKDEQYRGDLMGYLPAKADEKTWGAIWEAVKRETMAKHPKMDVKSEEFLQLAGERFSEVIEKTQVYDSVLARSSNMRSKSGLMQMATAFMAEPTTTINLLEDAIRSGKAKNIARAFGSVAVSIVLNNALASVVYAMRDDDEDETFIEKYFQSFTSGVIDDINPMSYYPFLKDVYSLFQGYDVERSDMSVIADLRDAMKKAVTAIGKYDPDMDDEKFAEFQKAVGDSLMSLLDAGCSAFGVPVKNVRRDVNGIINAWNTIGKDITERDTTWRSFWDKVGAAAKDTVPIYAWTNDRSKADKLYDAIISGDKAYVARLKSGYKNDNAYHTAVRTALRENDPRIREAAQAHINGDPSKRVSIAKQIIADGFVLDDVVTAINSEINKLTPDDGSSANKVKGMYKAEDFVREAANGDWASLGAIRADLIQTAQANGKTKADAEKDFMSNVKRDAKEAYLSGSLRDSTAEKLLTQYAGMDEEEAAATVSYWAFCKAHPRYQLSEANVAKYQEFAEPADIPVDVFAQYVEGTKGIKTIYDEWGDVEKSARDQVLEVIDSLPLTWQQKDALYLAHGYSESTIWDVPW